NRKPEVPIEWLSDNEAIYTSLETVIQAEQLGLAPITTPVASPESNGIRQPSPHNSCCPQRGFWVYSTTWTFFVRTLRPACRR
ncbi:MAG TPA: hypothetical protein VFI79_17895, partial [Gemmatimonadales bacterium]|nr:hypothetical protein [Gemmatimonadales bacterium]